MGRKPNTEIRERVRALHNQIPKLTLQEIADKAEISRQRVHQILLAIGEVNPIDDPSERDVSALLARILDLSGLKKGEMAELLEVRPEQISRWLRDTPATKATAYRLELILKALENAAKRGLQG